MTDQEKTQILLKWARFQSYYKSQAPEETGIEAWVQPPDSERTIPIPDFLHSLDAQAKWLWPKLTSDKGYTPDGILMWFECGTWLVEIWWMTRSGYEGRGLTPAEACAEAILSLIGEENED